MEKIRDRIRKLLRLAHDKGASEHEAANALAMASRLMLEHNIEHVGDEEESSRVIHGQRMGVDRGDKWERYVASATAKLYSCKSVHWKYSGDHAFVGKSENIEACEVTFLWICEQVEELYKEGLKTFKKQIGEGLGQQTRGNFRKTFKEGCAVRIYRRVEEIVAANRGNIPGHMALVVIDQSLKEAEELMKGMGIKKGRSVSRYKSGLGTGAGMAAGDAVKLQGSVDRQRSATKRIGR
jgi:hypothetical protein